MLLKQLEDMVSAYISHEKAPTQELLRTTILMVRAMSMFQPITDVEAEALARQLEAKLDVSMAAGSQLVTPEFQPWLPSRRKDIVPFYWDRYRKLLVQQGLPPGVISSLDEVTERIAGLLEDPEKPGPWSRRGMVVGHVQSGKTANYSGVLCKAADAGYRLIIVVAGVHNNLRSQTQARIDEGFIGRDTGKGMVASAEGNRIGVGRFDYSRKPVSFTNTLRDFNKQQASLVGVALDNLKEPAVLVIKKNSSTLGSVIAWLKEHNAKRGTKTIPVPMLLIDDEADNASINTAKGKGEVTKINGQLRDLLRMFERNCYVGYTATPFANIFIDPDSDDQMYGEDLFPRDFIVSLDPPDNYFGARKVFIDDGDRILRTIDDNEDVLPLVHKKSHPVAGLPRSLHTAIGAFALARAIRVIRGQGAKHSSMLINVSRFTDVQTALRNEVHEFMRGIQNAARVYGALPPDSAEGDPTIAALRRAFEEEFADCGHPWKDVLASLHEATAPIRVVEVNSRTAAGLEYADHKETGLNVIAIGGFSLSRGLTLEGLIISYFLRNSMMYDTLMQMGRWFGYRPGYEDLCRIWMPDEARGWYEHIAGAIEELRDELKAMEAVKATPKEFGLKVRSHPDTLIVTARNKMGTGQKLIMRIGLGKSFIETAVLKGDALQANRDATSRFALRLREIGKDPAGARQIPGGLLLDDVPASLVIEFIRSFRNAEGSFATEPRPVAAYIEERAPDELACWQVLLAGLRPEKSDTTPDASILGVPIHCQKRTMGTRSNDKAIFVSNKQRVSSRGIEKAGLLAGQIGMAEEAYRSTNPDVVKAAEKSGKPINYPDHAYREVRRLPLLIVHLLWLESPNPKEIAAPTIQPVVAWSISFPATGRPEKRVEYVVGSVWLKENMPDENDEDLGGDDE